MTILSLNKVSIAIIYVIAIVLGFLHNPVLGWCISLYCFLNAIYLLWYTTNLKKNNHE